MSEDLEELLDNFIIRKPNEQPKTRLNERKNSKEGQKIQEYIPLLVRDVLQSTRDPEDSSVFTTLNPAQLSYRTCLVYGYVAGRGVHNKSYYKYLIDDGTGTMEFSISTKTKECKQIRNLFNEASALTTSGPKYEKISSVMIRLLGSALESIDGSTITPGNNIFLCGRPNYYRNTISLDVFSFAIDKGKCRKLELAFADNLIDFYNNYRDK